MTFRRPWFYVNETDYKNRLSPDDKAFLEEFNKEWSTLSRKKQEVDALNRPCLEVRDSDGLQPCVAINDPGVKTCASCKKKKATAYFHKDKNSTDGYVSSCNTCKSARRSEICRKKREAKGYSASQQLRDKLPPQVCDGCGVEKTGRHFPWRKKPESLYRFCMSCCYKASSQKKEIDKKRTRVTGVVQRRKEADNVLHR